MFYITVRGKVDRKPADGAGLDLYGYIAGMDWN